ncbi:MAG: InlB B-repeat-containing protein [Clostridia bacterium]|nr:InlB B-repeat-containing protein [Clostridia bacterium]
MKKMAMLALVALMGVLVLAGCSTADNMKAAELMYEGDLLFQVGEVVELDGLYMLLQYNDGSSRELEVLADAIKGFSTEKVGEYTIAVAFRGVEYTIGYRIVAEKYPVVTFNADGVQEIEPQTVYYGTTATEPESEVEGYNFLGFYVNGAEFDFSTPITASIEVELRYEKIGDLRTYAKGLLDKEMAKYLRAKYPAASYALIEGYYAKALADIEALDYLEDMKVCVTAFTAEAEQIEDYADMLKEYYEGIDAAMYFEHHYAQITEIYELAYGQINDYTKGAPLPEYIYEQAIESMEAVVTKEEDIALAEYEKTAKKRDLKNAYDGIDTTYFGVSEQGMIDKIYNDGIAAIEGAEGTKAVGEAYAAALEKLLAVANNKYIMELVTYYDGLKAEDYFAEDWEILVNIYEQAFKALKEYEAGAPTMATIVATAKDAMDRVNTKAEDIALADYEKTAKTRDLNNLYNGINRNDYADVVLANIDEAYAKGLTAINEAVGTRAVAAAYAEAYNAINEYLLQLSKGIEKMAALDEVYNAYKAEDYFDWQYEEITKIYNLAWNELRNYAGGAPSVETIYNQAIEAMNKVNTKAEDIALAEYEKTAKTRDLNNLYNGINRNDYADVVLANIDEAYANGLTAINEAVGTRAVAAAYAEAYNAINEYLLQLSKGIEKMAALDEVYNAYKAEDYFDWQYEEITNIYNLAWNELRNYAGGAPSVETIYNQAVEAMDKVTTKAEDIALAEYEKTAKARDLNNLYNGFERGNYSDTTLAKIDEAYQSGLTAISEAVGTRAVAAAYAVAYNAINELLLELSKGYEQMVALRAVYAAYNQADYFDWQWEAINGIYGEAIEDLRNFVGGAPSVETIYNQAVEAMDKVTTKAEDIALAEYEKTTKTRDLNALYNGINRENYADSVLANIDTAYNNGLTAISEAVGTKAVAAAYAVAYNAIKENLPQLSKGIEKMAELKLVYNTYSADNYFDWQWEAINGIYGEAIEDLRNFVGGAPSVETIYNQAVEAMDKVTTKAEDIALAEYEKTTKTRDLNALYNGINRENYADSVLANIDTAYNNGLTAISEAVGTKAVAAAYAVAYNAIKENLPQLSKGIEKMAELKLVYNTYSADNYFDWQWADLNEIYNDAMDNMRNFIGGAPSLDTLYADAVKAMDDVTTKEEDIALAEYEKTTKKRDLENFVAGLTQAEYTEENWATIQTLLANGLQAITDAVGTKAVAQAYADALAAIQAVEKIPA